MSLCGLNIALLKRWQASTGLRICTSLSCLMRCPSDCDCEGVRGEEEEEVWKARGPSLLWLVDSDVINSGEKIIRQYGEENSFPSGTICTHHKILDFGEQHHLPLSWQRGSSQQCWHISGGLLASFPRWPRGQGSRLFPLLLLAELLPPILTTSADTISVSILTQ